MILIQFLQLADAVHFNNLQLPILVSDRRPPEGQTAVISGWGGITAPPIQVPERLQYQYVHMIKFSDCRKVYPDITTAVCTNNGANIGVCSVSVEKLIATIFAIRNATLTSLLFFFRSG